MAGFVITAKLSSVANGDIQHVAPGRNQDHTRWNHNFANLEESDFKNAVAFTNGALLDRDSPLSGKDEGKAYGEVSFRSKQNDTNSNGKSDQASLHLVLELQWLRMAIPAGEGYDIERSKD